MMSSPPCRSLLSVCTNLRRHALPRLGIFRRMASNRSDTNIEFTMMLVRHGETHYNHTHRMQGTIDIPLNETGQQQVSLVAKTLTHEPITHVYSSDLCRAFETAAAIVEHNKALKTEGFGRESIKKVSLCRERSFGELEGESVIVFKSLADENGHGENIWGYVPKGGESKEDVIARAKKFFKVLVSDMIRLHSHQPPLRRPLVLLASHGIFIHSLNVHLQSEHQCSFPEGSTLTAISRNTAVSSFDVVVDAGTKRVERVTCTKLYNADHLEEVE